MALIDFESRPSNIAGLSIITMKQVADERGVVREFFRSSAYAGVRETAPLDASRAVVASAPPPTPPPTPAPAPPPNAHRAEHGLAPSAGGPAAWNQLNLTHTRRGAIRGLHGEQMTKLVGVVAGEAFGVYVDARPESDTFASVLTLTLAVGTQVLVPRGVLNGFQATGADGCEYLYCFDVEWIPGMAGIGVHPLDPGLAIPWPLQIDPADRSLLSAKDAALPSLSEVAPGRS